MTLEFEAGVFTLEGYGTLRAQDVMAYDQKGQLAWETVGTRGWVGAKAQAAEAGQPRVAASAVETGTSSWTSLSGRVDGRSAGQRATAMAGLLVLACGLLTVAYFFVFFDTSVPVDALVLGIDRVNNIGLMADRQNGIIVGFGMALAGGVLIYVGRQRAAKPVPASTTVTTAPPEAACGKCGKLVQVGVGNCTHCGQRLSWASATEEPG